MNRESIVQLDSQGLVKKFKSLFFKSIANQSNSLDKVSSFKTLLDDLFSQSEQKVEKVNSNKVESFQDKDNLEIQKESDESPTDLAYVTSLIALNEKLPQKEIAKKEVKENSEQQEGSGNETKLEAKDYSLVSFKAPELKQNAPDSEQVLALNEFNKNPEEEKTVNGLGNELIEAQASNDMLIEEENQAQIILPEDIVNQEELKNIKEFDIRNLAEPEEKIVSPVVSEDRNKLPISQFENTHESVEEVKDAINDPNLRQQDEQLNEDFEYSLESQAPEKNKLDLRAIATNFYAGKENALDLTQKIDVQATFGAITSTVSKTLNPENRSGFGNQFTPNSDQSETKKPEVLPKTFSRLLEKVSKVAEEVRRSKDGKSVSLELDPPTLGKIRVDMTLKDGGLHARLFSENTAVSELVRQKSSEIQMLLRKVATNLNEVTVSFGYEGNSSNSNTSNQSGSSFSQREQSPQLDFASSYKQLQSSKEVSIVRSEGWIA
jgi:flagellar hook-length control protein FliK